MRWKRAALVVSGKVDGLGRGGEAEYGMDGWSGSGWVGIRGFGGLTHCFVLVISGSFMSLAANGWYCLLGVDFVGCFYSGIPRLVHTLAADDEYRSFI